MEDYVVYLEPAEGGLYEFVADYRRRRILPDKYTLTPECVPVSRPLSAQYIAEKITRKGKSVLCERANDFLQSHESNCFWVITKTESGRRSFFTGKMYADKKGGEHKPEFSCNVRDALVYCTEASASEDTVKIMSEEYGVKVRKCYVARENPFCTPNVVVYCHNKRTGKTGFLKSLAPNGGLFYSNSVKDAYCVTVDEAASLFSTLKTRNPNISFTMGFKHEDLTVKEIERDKRRFLRVAQVSFKLS